MGVRRWLTTTDHKDIGLLYLWTGLLFFVIGGIPALLIRLELWRPGTDVLSMDLFNAAFTMHGTTMIFLAAMPAIAGLGNYLIPLMVGARDMAFPRLNALSYWVTLAGGLILWAPLPLFYLGQTTLPASGGWTMYPPLSLLYATDGTLTWAVGILLLGMGSTLGAVNFMTTFWRERSPDMPLRKVPLFVWAMMATSVLLVLTIPPLSVAALLTLLSVRFGAPVFDPALGGDPLLYQHLFWFFGHPEVYVAIFPFIGAALEIIPRFSGRRMMNPRHIIAAFAVATLLSLVVWAHHMYTAGLGFITDVVFGAGTAAIAVPFSVIIYNIIFTFGGGRVRLASPMLFALAFLVMFIMSGLEGLMLASPVLDKDLHDTYFVVGHFHYTLFGGSILGLFAALYYWFPRMYGRRYDERLAKWHFWLTLVFANVTFAAMDMVGEQGMPRHYQDYLPQFTFWNQVATVGAWLLGLAQLIFVYNYGKSAIWGEPSTHDPWDLKETPSPEWHGVVPGVPLAVEEVAA